MRSIQSGNVGTRYRKKRRKQKFETLTVTVPEIPEELLIQILIKLEVKSLMRFKCVSKHWLSLISSPYFTNQHRQLKPLRFFAYLFDKDNPKNHAWFRTSSSSVSMMNQDLTLPRIHSLYWSVSGGLVCFRNGANVQILNPHTGQVAVYPTVRCKKNTTKMSYIGYNPAQDVYKVLNVASEYKSMTSEHQVLVLGAGSSWRNLQSHISHRPCHRLTAMTVNGVLYYGAESWEKYYNMLVSFDLTSEEFTFIKLPVNTYFSHSLLMNYQGKVALMDHGNSAAVKVWVLEDAKKSQWSCKKIFPLPIWHLKLVKEYYRIGATSRSGQVWLTKEPGGSRNNPNKNPIKSFSFIIFNVETNEITQKIETGPLPVNFTWWLSTFLDDMY